MRGQDVRERGHDVSFHELAGVKLECSLPIWCRKLNLIGRADLVEFHGDVLYPVEFKSGRKHKGNPETLQLCAHALYLEEMFGISIDNGAIFWYGSRERHEIIFTDAMRQQVAEVVLKVAGMLEKRMMPPPVNDQRCENCSLKELCMPAVVAEKARGRKAAKDLFVV